MTTTKPGTRNPPPFELIGGNVCLDFINTLDDRPSGEPKELIESYYDLARFGKEAGILSAQQYDHLLARVKTHAPREAENARRRAIHLRESMYAVFSALMDRQLVPPVAMDVLNSSIQDAAQHLRLIQREKIPSKIVSPEPTVEWRFDDLGSAFDAMLWPITRAAADLLASSDLGFVRACSSPTCQWFFLDTSKNHHRRWCSMQLCGNRTKVRKFYAKKKRE